MERESSIIFNGRFLKATISTSDTIKLIRKKNFKKNP